MPQPSDLFYIRNRAGEYWNGYDWTTGSSRTLYQLVNGDYQALVNIARRTGGELEPMGGKLRVGWWVKLLNLISRNGK